MSIELRTLGPVSLAGVDPERHRRVVTQPKRLGLLVYLAAADSGGYVPRDRLLSVFWPESDASRARNSLNQALHHLRAALGPGVVEGRGQELGVAAGDVWCDAPAFRNPEGLPVLERLALYRGDFLDGFHVSGAPEFEHWMDRERSDLRSTFLDLAWRCVEEALRDGHTDQARRCAARARSVAPLDESQVMAYMALMERLDDPERGLREYRRYVRDLERELEIPPPERVAALADRLRERARTVPVPPGADAPVRAGKRVVRRGPNRVPAGPGESSEADGAGPGAPRHPAEATGAVSAGGAPSPPRPASSRRRRHWGGAGVAVALAAAGWGLWGGQGEGPSAVAVAPFVLLGEGDPVLAEGLHAELIQRLARIPGLAVRPRSAAMALPDTVDAAAEIARALEADYVVEAAVQMDGDRVRINAHMVDGREDRLLWSESFERSRTVMGILELQADIAGRIASGLRLRLVDSGDSGARDGMTESQEAYDAYLRGFDAYVEAGLTNVFIEKDRALQTAVAEYGRSVELDPSFAVAHAALAQAHTSLLWFGHDASPARRQAARQSAARALELAPDLPEGHYAMGRYLYQGERDYDGALEHLELARAGMPGSADVWAFIAYVHRRQGDLQEALAALEMAFELDPRDTSILSNLANTLRALDRPESAIRLYERALSLTPEAPHLYLQLARVHLFGTGDLEAGRQVMLRGAENVERPADLAPGFFYLATLEGDWEAARRALDGSRDAFWGLDMQAGPQEALVPLDLHRARVRVWEGRPDLAEPLFRRSRDLLAARLRSVPDDPRVLSSLALALAGLGQEGPAVSHARRATALIPLSLDVWVGAYHLVNLAEVWVLLGQPDRAVEALELAAAGSRGVATPVRLASEPRWEPLRDHPGFRRLTRRR